VPPARHSAKKIFFFEKSLPSVSCEALGKENIFFKKNLYRVPPARHSAKTKILFFKKSLPSVSRGALGKENNFF